MKDMPLRVLDWKQETKNTTEIKPERGMIEGCIYSVEGRAANRSQLLDSSYDNIMGWT